MILQSIANSIAANHPECYLMVLLIDERPEEVTDMQRTVKGEVQVLHLMNQHKDVAVAEMVIEKQKINWTQKRCGNFIRLVTRLGGHIMQYQVLVKYLEEWMQMPWRPKIFLELLNIEEGGSLTIISTTLIDTGSRMDEVILKSLKELEIVRQFLIEKFLKKEYSQQLI